MRIPWLISFVLILAAAHVTLPAPVFADKGEGCNAVVEAIKLGKKSAEDQLSTLKSSAEYAAGPTKFSEQVAKLEKKIAGMQLEIDKRMGAVPLQTSKVKPTPPPPKPPDGSFKQPSSPPAAANHSTSSLAQLPETSRYDTVTALANSELPPGMQVSGGAGYRKLSPLTNGLDGVEYKIPGVARPDMPEGVVARVRVHSPDSLAAARSPTSNSGKGWTVVIESGADGRFRYGPEVELVDGAWRPVRDGSGKLRWRWYDLNPATSPTPKGILPVPHDGSALSEAIMNEMHVPIATP